MLKIGKLRIMTEMELEIERARAIKTELLIQAQKVKQCEKNARGLYFLISYLDGVIKDDRIKQLRKEQYGVDLIVRHIERAISWVINKKRL